MITAHKRRWFERLFARYTRRRLRSAFARVDGRGWGEVREAAAQHPLVFIANHSSWWDGMLALHLSHSVANTDGYAMLESSNLASHRFFRMLGGFGVDREDPRDGVRGLRYAAGLLDRPRRAVWIFPQGKECPAPAPLQFLGGAAMLGRLCPELWVVPVGLRYRFGTYEQPLCAAVAGRPRPITEPSVATAEAQAATVAALLADADAAATVEGATGFAPLLRRPGSWLESLGLRALDGFGGWMLRGADQSTARPKLQPALPPRDRA